MRSNRINYIAVGTFVILVVAGLVVAVTLLSGRTGATETYYTVYNDVSGVQFGTQVRFQGYRIGQVERVEPQTGGDEIRFRVVMSIQEGFPIPADSRATVSSSSLLGGVSIEITGGEKTRTLEPGAQIAAGRSGDVFSAVSRLAGEFNTLSEQGVAPLLEKLNASASLINQVIADTVPRIAQDLQTATGSLAKTTPEISGDVKELSATLNEDFLGPDTLRQFRSTVTNLEQASTALNEGLLNVENRERFATTLANLQTFSREFIGLSKELRETQSKVDRLMGSLDQMVTENREPLNQSVQDLRYSLDSVSRHVDAITYNLESTSRNMHEFARQIRQNPSLLLRGGSVPAER